MAMSDPGLAAITIKETLLNNVDELTDLDGLVTSRGRLNLHQSLLGLQELCEDAGSTFGFGVAIDFKSNEFTWNENKSGLQTDLRIRQFDEMEWVEYLDISSGFNLPDLPLCDQFEYQTRSYVIGDTTAWGFSSFFETEGCCFANALIDLSIVDDTLFFNLESDGDSIDNYVEYRLYGEQEWTAVSSKEDINIGGFEPCSLIEYRIFSRCDDINVDSDTTAINVISTECGQCTAIEYCVFDEYDNDRQWIESISIDSEPFVSGQGVNSYNEFIGGYIPVLALGSDYDLVLEPGFSGSALPEIFQIYIDLDQDGIFDETTERIFETIESSKTSIEDTLKVPKNGLPGLTRMRVIMSFLRASESCDYNGSAFGEVEDYCIELTPNVGVDDFEDLVNMQITPSISDGIFKVNINAHKSSAGKIIVTSIDGRVVYDNELNLKSQHRITIDGMDWQSGLHILTYATEHGNYSQKIIKL
jgi:hypothetical protein